MRGGDAACYILAATELPQRPAHGMIWYGFVLPTPSGRSASSLFGGSFTSLAFADDMPLAKSREEVRRLHHDLITCVTSGGFPSWMIVSGGISSGGVRLGGRTVAPQACMPCGRISGGLGVP